jgi:hypothetical protein
VADAAGHHGGSPLQAQHQYRLLRSGNCVRGGAFFSGPTEVSFHEFFQDKGTEADAIEAIALCLEQGLDINAFNDNGDTAVHRASGQRIVRFLVANGAELDVRNKQRKTPLDMALERKDRNGAIRYPERSQLSTS